MKSWLIRHPRTLGVLFFVLSAFAFRESLDGARIQQRFADAQPVKGQVTALTQHSAFPPRWRADVAPGVRRGPASVSVIVGTGRGWSDPAVSVGQTLDILIASDGREPALLASRRKTDFMRVGPLRMERTEFWFGAAFAVAGLLCFVFARRIEREAAELFRSA